MSPFPEPIPATDRLRRSILAGLLVGALFTFAYVLQGHVPLRHWLAFRYLACWGGASLFLVACACAGFPVVQRLAAPGIDRPTRLLLALAAGVYLFFLGVFVLGLLGLLNKGVFFLLPLAMIAAGGPASRRAWRQAPAASGDPAPTGMDWLVQGLGVLGVTALYLPVLVPTQISYDARWYHMAIAEHYVAQGAVRPFDGGWIAGSVPHLTSFLYTWAFLAPGARLFDQIVLSMHLEFVLFLGTLAGVHLAIRALIPRAPASSWAALFLFPGILVYDSGLIGGADHIAAFFAAPILLALLQLWRSFDARSGLLLALFLSACFLTKYSALNLFLPPALAAGGWGLWLLASRRERRGEVGRGLLALVLGGLALTAPHWLRNWLSYGAPFYPLFTGIFRPRPWTPDSAQLLEFFRASSRIPGVTPPEDLRATLLVLVQFSLLPHDWQIFHKNLPVFGSLFTLLTPTWLLLRSWRFLGIAALCYGGLLLWIFVGLQDRYLQTLVPLMAALCAATLVLLWRSGGVLRWGGAALVGVQLLWSADHYFIPSHSMLYDSAIRHAVGFFAMGYEKKFDERFVMFGDFPRAGEVLPPGARVLVHGSHLHLGLRAPSVLDQPPDSIAIGYGRTRTMQEMHELMRKLRVNHVFWPSGQAPKVYTLADDLMFSAFVTNHLESVTPLAGHKLGKIPAAPPPPTPPLEALVLGCDATFKSGRYPVSKLHIFPQLEENAVYPAPEQPWPKEPEKQRALLDRVALLAVDPNCKLLNEIPAAFKPSGKHRNHDLYHRP